MPSRKKRKLGQQDEKNSALTVCINTIIDFHKFCLVNYILITLFLLLGTYYLLVITNILTHNYFLIRDKQNCKLTKA